MNAANHPVVTKRWAPDTVAVHVFIPTKDAIETDIVTANSDGIGSLVQAVRVERTVINPFSPPELWNQA